MTPSAQDILLGYVFGLACGIALVLTAVGVVWIFS